MGGTGERAIEALRDADWAQISRAVRGEALLPDEWASIGLTELIFIAICIYGRFLELGLAAVDDPRAFRRDQQLTCRALEQNPTATVMLGANQLPQRPEDQPELGFRVDAK
jgi:hypothetical protein